MHKNDVVVTINISTENEKISIHDIVNYNLLPFGTKHLEKNELIDGILFWNENRCIPTNRPNFQNLMAEIGIHNYADLIPHSHLCSLTDCYWFKHYEDTCQWADVNFHQNNFSSKLDKYLFFDSNDISLNDLDTPDITTNGALSKTWEKQGEHFVLIKGNQRQYPIEACYERIASEILSQLQIPHVDYDIIHTQHGYQSACSCFIIDDSEEFVSMEDFLLDFNISAPEGIAQLLQGPYRESFEHMFLCDIIIGNTDRHARNYGFIIDSNTQEFKCLAPLFDHGICALTVNHGPARYKPLGISFNESVKFLSDETLSLSNNLDFKRIADLVFSLPIDDGFKNKVVAQLESRIGKLQELARKKDIEIDRE